MANEAKNNNNRLKLVMSRVLRSKKRLNAIASQSEISFHSSPICSSCFEIFCTETRDSNDRYEEAATKNDDRLKHTRSKMAAVKQSHTECGGDGK